MLTENQYQTIDQYIDGRYFDKAKIVSYLQIHDIVGEEIFEISCKRDAQRNLRLVSNTYGYEPIDVDLFISRIPFYFYEPDFDKDQHGSLTNLIYGLKDFAEPSEWEHLYCVLERLFYHHHLAIPDLMGYIVKQTGVVNRTDLFFEWANYVDLCETLHSKDFYPKCFLYSYNLAREKCGLEPTIYLPGLVGFNENFLRQGKEIIIGGEFPCDENNQPEMRWIGIWVENAKYVKVKKCYSVSEEVILEKELHIGLTPTTKIFMPNIYNEKGETRDVWYPIYIGPQVMEFDSTALKFFRSEAKMTQQVVADAIGVQLRTYQKWEGGVTIPDGYNMIRIMNLLDIPSVQDFVKINPIIDNGFKLFINKEDNTLYKE